MMAKVESPEILIFSSGSIWTATVRLIRVAYSKPAGLSPVPYVGQVAWQASGNDEHGVDADVVTLLGEAWCKPLGRYRNPSQPIVIEGPGCSCVASALFDLDECYGTAAAGYQVDFAAWDARPFCQNPPAFQAQPPGSNRFRPTASGFGELPFHFWSGQRRNANTSPLAMRFKNVFRSTHS